MHSGRSISQPVKGAIAVGLLMVVSTAGAAAWAADLTETSVEGVSYYDSSSTPPEVRSSGKREDDERAAAPAKKSALACRDHLTRTLRKVGFRGDNLRQAWAIAMRESGGDPKLGPGHWAYNGEDVGLFQFNRPTFSGKAWWDERKLLTAKYNARLAYELSQGGRDWWLWGLDGDGNLDPGAYTAVWTWQEIDSWILQPYRKYYAQYPCAKATQ